MEYFLLNKNEKLLSFKTESRLGSVQVIEIKSFSTVRPQGFSDIASWIDKRDYAKHKDHFKKWLKEWGMDTVDGFISATHCLGLNDCLWVKPIDSPLLWENVNLYKNQFTDVAARTAFETGLFGLQLSSTSPEFTAEGTFPKFWKKENDTIRLYKAGMTGAANVGLEPYSEYMSSFVARKISKTPVVEYGLSLYKGKVCSFCSLFTNEEIGFVPAYKILDPSKKYTILDVIDVCKTLGFERECAEMFYIDSIVFNQDRHLGNFGFLINNETFEIVGFAPLFDFNISMLCNAMTQDLNNLDKYFEEYLVGHKLGGTFVDVGQALAKEYGFSLPGTITLPVHEKYNLEQTRFNQIENIFENNIKVINGVGKNIFVSSLSKANENGTPIPENYNENKNNVLDDWETDYEQ